ncbi:MAG: CoA pyrophosphatase [Desulfurococcales archaeon]|nr:CoA pyrophosphatase [Desulfurococcales archaeon]
MGPLKAEAAVLALLSGSGHVLLVRKSCSVPSPWACDVALPGGHVDPGEDEVGAALREAWEEAGVPGDLVEVLCLAPLHATSRGSIIVRPVIALARAPICPKPRSEEVDAAFWVRLEDAAGRPPRRLRHPRGFTVTGVELAGGLVLWGLTLRILTWLYSALPLVLEARGGACDEGPRNSGGRC